MQLKKLSDYVEELEKEQVGWSDFAIHVINRKNLLKQKPTLGMFVPCDLDGNVLEEPCGFNNFLEYGSDFFNNQIECKIYQEAEERVLFKGFVFDGRILSNDNIDMDICDDNLYLLDKSNKIETLEDLTPYNLELK